jgi:transposase
MDGLKKKFKKIIPILNERQRRLYLASEAEALGRGGVTKVFKASNVSRVTITHGKQELKKKIIPSSGIRNKGGGRKKLSEHDDTLLHDLELLVEPLTRGHPESALRWTCKSTRKLAAELKKGGHSISHTVVGELLKELGYSLQSNAKRLEGTSDPDRNDQFEYINKKTEEFIKKGIPVISVDTKKKELVGNYKNNGKEYRKQGKPREVEMHDFGDKRAVPYGVYDIGNNKAFVNVGITSDTAQFAVASIRQWWKSMGKKEFSDARQLMITADSGGSNGYRLKLWKTELQNFSNETGMKVSVSHFPPGTSKWNKIEHRLFSYISMNWRGIPLVDFKTIVQLIGSVKTTTGLKVKSKLDQRNYKKGINVTKDELAEVKIKNNKFRGEWNYTIYPNS